MDRTTKNDSGVAAVLGSMLMIALMVSMIPGIMLFLHAIQDAMQAERERAELAAWCARHPDTKDPRCAPFDTGPAPWGWECSPPPGEPNVDSGTMICRRAGASPAPAPGSVVGPVGGSPGPLPSTGPSPAPTNLTTPPPGPNPTVGVGVGK